MRFAFADLKTSPTGRLLRHALGLTCVAALLGNARGAGDAPKGATVEEAAKAFDLSTLPKLGGDGLPSTRTVAGLSYNTKKAVKETFEFHKSQLADAGWKEMPNTFVSEQSANATFTRDGWTLSLGVSPAGAPTEKTSHVRIINHGNIAPSALPVPPGVKPLYVGPASALYVGELPVKAAADAVRDLLLKAGWRAFGSAGDSQNYKQNAVRLIATTSTAPAHEGKTVISYSTTLMSTDFPYPDSAVDPRYSDSPNQLAYDTPEPEAEVVKFTTRALAPAGWKSTTEAPVEVDFRNVLIYGDPGKNMMTLTTNVVDGKTRVVLRRESAAEVAEALARLDAQAAARKKEMAEEKAFARAKALAVPKIVVPLPAGATKVSQTESSLTFTPVAGRARAFAEAWRKPFTAAGWKETAATLEPQAGLLILTSGGMSLTITYTDTGVLSPEITIDAMGVKLELPGGSKPSTK